MSGKPFLFISFILLPLMACTPAIQASNIQPTSTETSPVPTGTPTSAILSAPEDQKANTPAPTKAPPRLELQKIEQLPDNCSDWEQGLPGEGLSEVAYFPSGFCFHGELDVFETGGRVYVAQVLLDRFGASEAAFRIVDVTDVQQPSTVGAWKWNFSTYSADVKAFRQGDRHFLALSREPFYDVDDKHCRLVGGIAIIEVTQPAEPKLITLLTGASVGSTKKWCSSHTAEVGRDADGNGAHLYVSATDSFDLRVLDISDLENVTEAGHYTHPDAGYYNDRNWFYVHDTTITDDRVYVANWSAGLIILDRETIESGKRAVPLNPLDSIDPYGLQIHHSYPTTDGNFVFVEDEYLAKEPESRLRLYDIRNPNEPKEVATITLDDSLGAAPHNLLVAGDQLFVGWYQDGVRVFRYDVSDPENPTVEPAAFQTVRTRLTTNGGQPYDGIWGVRARACEVAGKQRTCVFASDITYGLLILALDS